MTFSHLSFLSVLRVPLFDVLSSQAVFCPQESLAFLKGVQKEIPVKR